MHNIYPCCEVNLSRNCPRDRSNERLADHDDDEEVGVKSEPEGWHASDNADVYLGHAVDEPEPDATDCYDASDSSNIRQGCQMVF